ncbi:alpha/beta hydrolase family protein [Thalassotalea atypica]|uniref:alpha/beta hydrolase family protein n=1 Tax=Thalassotalea atypica TaxID=2054316 RepID=UPI00257341DB|nr:prolyl oligopeptidase family serine peptidase [Thalassotalea atypica]
MEFYNYHGVMMKNLVLLLLMCVMPTMTFADNADVFGRLPLVSQVQISPSGNHFAYMRDMNGKYAIVSQSLTSKAKPQVFGMKEAEIRHFTWVSDQHLLLSLSTTQYSPGDFETFTMHRKGILDVKSNQVTWLFKGNSFRKYIGSPTLVSKLPNDEEHILVTFPYRHLNALYRIDLSDGDHERIFEEHNAEDWLTDDNGEVYSYQRYLGEKDKWVNFYRSDLEHDFIRLTTIKGGKEENFKPVIVNMSPDRKTIYYWQYDDLAILVKAKVEQGVVGQSEVVIENAPYDIEDTIWDYHNQQVVGVVSFEDYPEYYYFDQQLAQVQADLKATYQHAQIDITSYDRNKERFIIYLSGEKYPERFTLYDRKAGSIQPLAEGFPIKDKSALGHVKSYRYKTSDDVEIHSFLTMPAGDAQKPPLIVLPHGGPEMRDVMSFDWIRQFYASEGFAVFQPNYRGSAGYGKKFKRSGHGEWGKRMQDDIDEGVHSLIEAGLVDPKRICVVGSSYGGYVALFSATVKYKLYQCAVSFAGVSNLGDMYLHAKEQKSGFSYWRKNIGKTAFEDLHKISPFHLVSKKTLPVLLMHGTEDTVVPLFQSKKFYKKLVSLGDKDSKFIELEGEDHWLSKGQSRNKFLFESLKFINTHIDENSKLNTEVGH